jgi:hypothetical protein
VRFSTDDPAATLRHSDLKTLVIPSEERSSAKRMIFRSREPALSIVEGNLLFACATINRGATDASSVRPEPALSKVEGAKPGAVPCPPGRGRPWLHVLK